MILFGNVSKDRRPKKLSVFFIDSVRKKKMLSYLKKNMEVVEQI